MIDSKSGGTKRPSPSSPLPASAAAASAASRPRDNDDTPLVALQRHAMPLSPSRTCDVASGGKLGREALQLQKDMEKFEQQRLHQAQQQQKQLKAEEKSSLPRAVLQLQVTCRRCFRPVSFCVCAAVWRETHNIISATL